MSLESEVAVVTREIDHINKRLDSQDAVLIDQSKDIKTLLEMAHKSRGALWAIMSLASGFGVLAGLALAYFKKIF